MKRNVVIGETKPKNSFQLTIHDKDGHSCTVQGDELPKIIDAAIDGYLAAGGALDAGAGDWSRIVNDVSRWKFGKVAIDICLHPYVFNVDIGEFPDRAVAS